QQHEEEEVLVPYGPHLELPNGAQPMEGGVLLFFCIDVNATAESGDKWRWHHQFLDVPGMFGLLYSDIVWFNIFK
ncbi:hypothetical protein ACJX0J_042353, partial [Zea mays]